MTNSQKIFKPIKGIFAYVELIPNFDQISDNIYHLVKNNAIELFIYFKIYDFDYFYENNLLLETQVQVLIDLNLLYDNRVDYFKYNNLNKNEKHENFIIIIMAFIGLLSLLYFIRGMIHICKQYKKLSIIASN